MSSSHEIIIDNFKPDETVHYSVIIIKGHVKNGSNALCGSNEIYINSSTNSQFKLIEHKFKILAELNLGQNSIWLKYCCTSIKITLNYCQKPTNFLIIPLYIICQDHDGKFQAPETENNTIESACKRITLCSKLLQSVIAEKLYEENLGRKTFKVEECQVFHSKLNYLKAREMTQEQLWNNLGREIANSSLQSEEIKFLGFLSCTIYTTDDDNPPQIHDDIIKSTQAYVALGGGGLALFGSACLYTWPEDLSKVIEHFQNNTPINTKKFMDDSCYRGTWGGCFSTTLGSVLHELCHTFDLGHTEKGIMGRGFDNIYKVFMINKNEKTLLNNFQSNIEFKEKLNSNKKIFTVNKNRIIEEDDTFWTKSCLLLLAYHRWINDATISANKTIKFDRVTKFIISTAGIRVIELRNETDGMVLKYWTFQGRVLKYSFQIPHDDFNQNIPVLLLVVEDNVGNILKQNI